MCQLLGQAVLVIQKIVVMSHKKMVSWYGIKTNIPYPNSEVSIGLLYICPTWFDDAGLIILQL